MFLIRSKRFYLRPNKIFQTLYRDASSSGLTKLTNVQEKVAESFENEEKNGFVVPIFKKSLLFGNNTAIRDESGSYTYVQLFAASQRLAFQLSNIYGSAASRSVCFLCPNNVLTLLAFWACWISGQVAVPLSGLYPTSMIKFAIEDSQSKLLITTPDNEGFLKPLVIENEMALVIIDHTFLSQPSSMALSNIFISNGDNIFLVGTLANDFYTKADAMIEYTPVANSNPKGKLLTHKDLNAQIKCLTHTMQFRDTDCVLHIFPVNSIHGGINVIFSPLCCGAKVVMMDRFSSLNVWNGILGINIPEKERANIIMGVPVIYDALIEEYFRVLGKNSKIRRFIRSYCSENIRMMTTAFPSLKQETFDKWKAITGHCLLEGSKL